MHRKYLEKWLRDAYAMEKAAVEMLEKQVKSLEDYPQVRVKIQQHLDESKWQAEEINRCLEKLGTKPSGFKETLGKIMANMAVMTNATADDHLLKDFIANSAFEHIEIASYRSLIAAAEECGEPQIRLTCEEILVQEEAMAKWCEDQIPSLTQEFLTRHSIHA